MTHPLPIRRSREFAAVLRLAAPLALANLLQMGVYAIDVVFVGHLGQQALAASSLAVTLFTVQVWPCMALTSALAPFVAEVLGREDVHGRSPASDAEIGQTVRMALWLGVMCAGVVVLVCGSGRALLLALGEPRELATRAGGFLAILRWAMLPMVFANVLRTYASALGRPTIATLITGLAVGINALGNYTLVFGHFGVARLGLPTGLPGAAVASVLTAGITFLLYLIAVRTDPVLRERRVFVGLMRPHWPVLRDLLRIGVPMGITVVAEAGLFGAAAFILGRFGEAALAAHTVAIQVASIAFMLPFGVGQAATIRVGFHLGAEDRLGIARAGWMALGIGAGFALINATIMVAAPRLVISAYVDLAAPGNAAMAALAVRYLQVAAAFQLADSTQTIAAGALRGLQDTRVPMAIALCGYWLLGLGTSLYLGFATPLAGLGVWLGLLVGLAVVAVSLVWRWGHRDAFMDTALAREARLSPGQSATLGHF